VEATEDGWWYSAPRPDGEGIAVAYLTDPDLLPRVRRSRDQGWWLLLNKGDYTAARVRDGGWVGGIRVVAAGSSRAGRIAGRNWLAAGDAAAARDPLCGQGVYRALESGLLAAAAVADDLRGVRGALADYAHLIEDGFAAYLEEQSVYYHSERRWPESPFWTRRHATLMAL
jgi:flavin-dependent dehydrogenase